MRTRTLTLIVSFVVVAYPAFAQATNERAILDFTEKGVSVRFLAKALIEQSEYTVSGLETIDPNCTWQRTLTVESLRQALNTILPYCDNVASIVGKHVTIRKRRQAPPAPSAPAIRRASLQTAQRPLAEELGDDESDLDIPEETPASAAQPAQTQPRNEVTQPTDPNIWSSQDLTLYGPLPPGETPNAWRSWQRELRKSYGPQFVARYNAEEQYRRMGGGGFVGGVNPGTVYGAGYGQGSWYGYNPGMYPWLTATPGCLDRPPAFLEVDYEGARKEKRRWLVMINGNIRGSVDQADTLRQRLPVCSDASVQVTVQKMGQPWKWVANYIFAPFESTEVPVGDDLESDWERVVRVRRR